MGSNVVLLLFLPSIVLVGHMWSAASSALSAESEVNNDNKVVLALRLRDEAVEAALWRNTDAQSGQSPVVTMRRLTAAVAP